MNNENNEQVNVMDDDLVLRITQTRKLDLVNKMANDIHTKGFETIDTYVNLLNSLDRVALANKKLKADEKANDKLANAAVLVQTMLRNLDPSSRSLPLQNNQGQFKELPELPDVETVPGETLIGVEHLTKEEFLKD